MFFESWSGLMRVLVAAVLGYAALVAMLRVSGKRTLAKMNAFDLVVTVALGSTLATLVLSKDVPIAEGASAFAVLICLQWIVAWAARRWRMVEQLVKSEPRLLYYRGTMLEDALRAERVTPDEVMAAIRGSANSDPSACSVVLETDGSFSVVATMAGQDPPQLSSVRGAEVARSRAEQLSASKTIAH